jgi:hypothetical protein
MTLKPHSPLSTSPTPLSVESPPFRARDDAKRKIKENEMNDIYTGLIPLKFKFKFIK